MKEYPYHIDMEYFITVYIASNEVYRVFKTKNKLEIIVRHTLGTGISKECLIYIANNL